MKIFAISDLHLSTSVDKPMNIFGESWSGYIDIITEDWKSKVGDDDVVLLSGDLSWAMNLQEVKSDIELVAALPGKKVIIKGNHDYWWNTVSKVRKILPANMYAVQNDCVRISNLLICGSRLWQQGLTGEDDIKILKREEVRLKLSLDAMSKMRKSGDKVIVMCHYPPFNAAFDDSAYTELISQFDVDAVVYGHLHGKNCRAERIVDKKGLKYYLTSCDLIDNKLVLIDNI